MSRIILTTIGSLGDLHPKLALALELRQRGHSVVVARLGTSRTIARSQYTVDRVVKQLQVLLENPTYANKSTAIARSLSAEDGIKIACDAIEKQLSN